MGGVWVLEIDYQYNDHRAHGFVRADSWAMDLDQLVRKDADFQQAFYENYRTSGPLMVYEHIIDREDLALAATFPMHAFRLVEESATGILIENMSGLSLRKVWVRDNYLIEVETALDDGDIDWIGGKAKLSYPLGDEMGCRLEVYNFGTEEVDDVTMEALIEAYHAQSNEKGGFLTVTTYSQILAQLKQQKIVVVELCGC